jgi:hypothetical protein
MKRTASGRVASSETGPRRNKHRRTKLEEARILPLSLLEFANSLRLQKRTGAVWAQRADGQAQILWKTGTKLCSFERRLETSRVAAERPIEHRGKSSGCASKTLNSVISTILCLLSTRFCANRNALLTFSSGLLPVVFSKDYSPVSLRGREHGPSIRSTMHAVVLKFTELYQPATPGIYGARGRSVSSWHGMPTASVKNKHFRH